MPINYRWNAETETLWKSGDWRSDRMALVRIAVAGGEIECGPPGMDEIALSILADAAGIQRAMEFYRAFGRAMERRTGFRGTTTEWTIGRQWVVEWVRAERGRRGRWARANAECMPAQTGLPVRQTGGMGVAE